MGELAGKRTGRCLDFTQATAEIGALRTVFDRARDALGPDEPVVWQLAGRLALALAEHDPSTDASSPLAIEAMALMTWSVGHAGRMATDSADLLTCLHRQAEVYKLLGITEDELFVRQEIVQLINRYPGRLDHRAALRASLNHALALENVMGPAVALLELEHLVAGCLERGDYSPVVLGMLTDITRLRLSAGLSAEALSAAQSALAVFDLGYPFDDNDDAVAPYAGTIVVAPDPSDPGPGDPQQVWEDTVGHCLDIIIDSSPRDRRGVGAVVGEAVSCAELCFGVGSTIALAARLRAFLWELTIATSLRKEHLTVLNSLSRDIALQTIEDAETPDNPASGTNGTLLDLQSRVNAHLGLAMAAKGRGEAARKQATNNLRLALDRGAGLDHQLRRRVEDALGELVAQPEKPHPDSGHP
ncbi:hypothetical protein ACFSSC_05625 [Corynebacterium mendelii]|uniref:Uncharacterized protein n=1 Tax=Corynebacterium mendelii TaxID=2765362 RepID=A0A939DXN2_9CORY|nr:hypothetical protein [Corynebacterium mendelii]MBN9643119.1 hypothetical protein [Corynebacterium mendelii]